MDDGIFALTGVETLVILQVYRVIEDFDATYQELGEGKGKQVTAP